MRFFFQSWDLPLIHLSGEQAIFKKTIWWLCILSFVWFLFSSCFCFYNLGCCSPQKETIYTPVFFSQKKTAPTLSFSPPPSPPTPSPSCPSCPSFQAQVQPWLLGEMSHVPRSQQSWLKVPRAWAKVTGHTPETKDLPNKKLWEQDFGSQKKHVP